MVPGACPREIFHNQAKPSGSLENVLFLDYLPSKEAKDHDWGSFAENLKIGLQFHKDTDYI